MIQCFWIMFRKFPGPSWTLGINIGLKACFLAYCGGQLVICLLSFFNIKYLPDPVLLLNGRNTHQNTANMVKEACNEYFLRKNYSLCAKFIPTIEILQLNTTLVSSSSLRRGISQSRNLLQYTALKYIYIVVSRIFKSTQIEKHHLDPCPLPLFILIFILP